jgi:predicted transposase YbfD/YdcC
MDQQRHVKEIAMATSPLSITKQFSVLKDPRLSRKRRHSLLDVIVIAICGVIAGCDKWEQIELFGKNHHDWLKRFLRLPNGIPSHDTFERVFDRIEPLAFQRCFTQWTQVLCRELGLKQVAIDGKTLRRSGNGSGLKTLHLVSAWATHQQLILGQVAVDDKSNEITAIPKLLELLDIKGAFVTIDAMGCQKAIASQIVEQGGDYVLTVKDNQPTLLQDIQQSFMNALNTDYANLDFDTYETRAQGHGRTECRRYTVLHFTGGLSNAADWKGITTIGMCYSERIVAGVRSEEVRYFIGSRKARARVYGKALRYHWGIENNLHWQMDVSFAEDDSRIQKRNAAENFAMLRRIALILLKRHPDKHSINTKRLLASWDTEFLQEVLAPKNVA